MSYAWNAIKGTLTCDNGVILISLPVPPGDDGVYELRYQNKVCSVVIERREIDGSIFTIIKSLGKPIYYPVAGAGLFRVNPYEFESLREEKFMAYLVIDPIKYISPKGSVVCLSTEFKKRLGWISWIKHCFLK
ncbi:MAG: hypothetical protein ACI910_000613 [Oleispira sp.]|jgi:hypothetical protein